VDGRPDDGSEVGDNAVDAAKDPSDGQQLDLAATFVLDAQPSDAFALANWNLDAGSFAGLQAALPKCTSIVTMKYGCSLYFCHTLVSTLMRAMFII
jgi:hypothetical protein